MKCGMSEKKSTTAMLAVGLVMLLGGAIAALVTGEEGSGLALRIMGFFSGLGGSLTAVAAFALVRRRVIGEARAADSEREMRDERGQMIALRAQNVFAFVATLGIIALIVTALIRDDYFYMIFGACVCFAMAIAKAAALRVYSRRL